VTIAAANTPKPDLFGPLLHGVGLALTTFWWFWLLVAAVGAVRVTLWIAEQRRIARSGIAEIDAMTGGQFEQRLAFLFRELGYRVEQTRARGDYGADLVVARDGIKTVVQAKRWTTRVGVKAVQEAVAAKPMYGCERAMVVTNSRFTAQARTLADANAVELWDRDELVGRLAATVTEAAGAQEAAA
jgi:restriction system protein